MIDAYLEELKTLLIKPVEFSLGIREKTLNAAFRHYTLMVIIFTFFFGILTVTFGTVSFISSASHYSSIPLIGWFISGFLLNFSSLVLSWHIFSVYLIFLLLLISVFIVGFLLEIVVLLVGGEQGSLQTMKTLMYAVTPALLLSWIPYLWILGYLWACVLLILFFEKTQQLSRIQAVLVVLVPFLLIGILILLGGNVIITLSDLVLQPIVQSVP